MIIHPISSLNYKFHELSSDDDFSLPDNTELVIFCGGISKRVKRSLLFYDTLCDAHPTIDMIYNIGPIEYIFASTVILPSVLKSKFDNLRKPNQLWSLEPFIYKNYDILCLVGWPDIDEIPTEYKFINGATTSKYLDTGEMVREFIELPATLDELKAEYAKERIRLKSWLASDNGKQKILITGTAPKNDPYIDVDYKLYEDLDLSGLIWIHNASETYDKIENGIRMISNPGRNSRDTKFII